MYCIGLYAIVVTHLIEVIGMRIIVVDDEKLALSMMEKLLQKYAEHEKKPLTIEYYQNPHSALIAASKVNSLELAFLDIELPEMNGFALAEQLLQLHSNLKIVFVTAYERHAIKAFEVNAVDYLLKPVAMERMEVTMKRVLADEKNKEDKQRQAKVTLCCFQRIHYTDAQASSYYLPWKTLKAQELFAYLIHHRNKTIDRQTLIDLLWPNEELDKASTQLHTAIYQIRQVIKHEKLDLRIQFINGGYKLTMGTTLLDIEQWEQQVIQQPDLLPETLESHLAIIKSYAGDYLEEHHYLWAENERERLRVLWLDHVKRVAAYYVSISSYAMAITLFHRIQEKFPYLEDGYWGLMQVYAKMNHFNEVRKQYQNLSAMLSEEFDIEPREEIIEWYNQLFPSEA